MKKILLIIPSGGVGGIERLALNFYNFYKGKGYYVKVLKIIKDEIDIVNFGEDELFLSDIDFSEMTKKGRLFFYLKSPLLLRKIILKHKFTDSISFGDLPNIFSSLTFTKENKVASLHALKSVEISNDSFLSTISKISYRTSYYFLDKVVCISEAIRKDLIEKCNFKFHNKLEVIYNPHNVEELVKLSNETLDDSFEKSLFEKKTILFIGRLTIQKSPWHLLKSFSLLENQNQINLVFIGDGMPKVKEYLDELIKLYHLENNVFFLGRKSNPYKYLAKSTLLALTSFYEGTPNVIVESIATNTPVVTSNCTDGIMELMQLNHYKEHEELIETDAGIITPNFFKGKLEIIKENNYIGEEHIFAAALNLVLNDLSYKERLLQNKTQLLEKYDVEKVAIKYLC